MVAASATILDDAEEPGPAMERLSPIRRAFVRAVLNMGRNGIENATEAARQAGYADTGQGIKVRAHALMHDPRVQAALLEESRKSINAAAAVVATPICVSIAMDEEANPRDRLRACEMLFNRGGMPALTEHKVTVEHTASNEKMLALAKRLAAELGMDETRLIGVNRAAANAIDAEFVELPK